MHRYGRNELNTFLQAIDQELEETVSLIIIGGSAIILGYNGELYTHDIDTYGQISHLQKAYEAAKVQTQLDIPLCHSTVADAPYHFETRLQEYTHIPLKKLHILIPEKHDLAMMKMIRGYQHDIQHIQEIAERVGLEYHILLSRFLEEMSHVVIDWNRLEDNFLYMIEELFGEEKAEETEKLINTEGTWLANCKHQFNAKSTRRKG